MKRQEYEKKLAKWESEGYEVSELREKWFPAKSKKSSSGGKWLAIVAVIVVVIVIGVVVTGWQLSKTPAPAPKPTPVPATPQKLSSYILSGGPSAAAPIVVDDDLIVEVNGKVIYHDKDKSSNTINPMTFSASPEDSVHIVALDLGWGARVLSSLYLISSDGKSYKITDAISQDSKSGESVFFDKTFKISDLIKASSTASAPAPAPLGSFNYMTYIGMNTKKELPLSDWRVRWSVYLSLDRDHIETVARDTNTQKIAKVVSIVTSDVPSPNLDKNRNIEKAKQLLAEAGYPDGLKIALNVPVGLEWLAKEVHNDLAEIGIDVEIKAWDMDTFTRGLQAGEWGFFLRTIKLNQSDTPELLKRLLFSTGDENFTGFSDAKFDELLKTGSFAEAENLAFDSRGMAVVPLFWHEESIYQVAPQKLPSYVISGGPSADAPIYVDDDLIVEVNGKVIFHDGDKTLSTLNPIKFQAYPRDSIHITAINVGGGSKLSGLYLHSDGKIYRITEGISNPESSELVFYDKAFQISSLPEMTTYVISGGPSALIPIAVDDDLSIEVNGETVYQDNDGTASVLDPIKFIALPGDLVHITALDLGWGARKLSSLYLISDGKSYKITDAITQESKSGERIFFDKTFKISELIGVGTTAKTPAPAPTAEPALPVPQYALSTSVSPSGSGIISPSSGTYDAGSKVTLSATAEFPYAFAAWSGASNDTLNPTTVTINSDTSVIAKFVKLTPGTPVTTKGELPIITSVTIDRFELNLGQWVQGEIRGDLSIGVHIVDFDNNVVKELNWIQDAYFTFQAEREGKYAVVVYGTNAALYDHRYTYTYTLTYSIYSTAPAP